MAKKRRAVEFSQLETLSESSAPKSDPARPSPPSNGQNAALPDIPFLHLLHAYISHRLSAPPPSHPSPRPEPYMEPSLYPPAPISPFPFPYNTTSYLSTLSLPFEIAQARATNAAQVYSRKSKKAQSVRATQAWKGDERLKDWLKRSGMDAQLRHAEGDDEEDAEGADEDRDEDDLSDIGSATAGSEILRRMPRSPSLPSHLKSPPYSSTHRTITSGSIQKRRANPPETVQKRMKTVTKTKERRKDMRHCADTSGLIAMGQCAQFRKEISLRYLSAGRGTGLRRVLTRPDELIGFENVGIDSETGVLLEEKVLDLLLEAGYAPKRTTDRRLAQDGTAAPMASDDGAADAEMEVESDRVLKA